MRKVPLLEHEMSYTIFVETMKSCFFENMTNEKNLKILLEYRAYLFIQDYNYQKKVIEQVISPLKMEKIFRFFQKFIGSGGTTQAITYRK